MKKQQKHPQISQQFPRNTAQLLPTPYSESKPKIKPRQLKISTRYTNTNTITNNRLHTLSHNRQLSSPSSNIFDDTQMTINRSSQSIRIHRVLSKSPYREIIKYNNHNERFNNINRNGNTNGNTKRRLVTIHHEDAEQISNRYHRFGDSQKKLSRVFSKINNSKQHKQSGNLTHQKDNFYKQLEKLKLEVQKVHGSSLDLTLYEKIQYSESQQKYINQMRRASINIMFRLLGKKFVKLKQISFLELNKFNQKSSIKQLKKS